MKFAVWTILALSVALNLFFIYENHYDTPDVDFNHTNKTDAYYIKEHHGDDFVIDHKGHTLTAACQPTLTWLHGVTNPGEPMSESCTYLPDLVGKSIAAGKMRREGKNLVYTPWSNDDTEQTADILTITDDQVIK